MQALKKRKDFQNVFEKGKWITRFNSPIRIKALKAENLRIGIVASRKVGNAVVRNRIKRQIRSIGRYLTQTSEIQGDFVLIVQPAFVSMTYHEKESRIQRMFQSFLAKQS